MTRKPFTTPAEVLRLRPRTIAPKPIVQPFEVWTTKFDGSSRFYQKYADRAVANDVVSRLREIGLQCELRVATTSWGPLVR